MRTDPSQYASFYDDTPPPEPMEGADPVTSVCANCGQTFDANWIYCSRECRVEAALKRSSHGN